MTNTEHYFPQTGHGGDGTLRHRKTAEERWVEQSLQKLITMRIARRRNPPITTRDEAKADLAYTKLHGEIEAFIARAVNPAFGERKLSPARQALARSVLHQKRPYLKTKPSLKEMVGGDILQVRDGDEHVEVASGQRFRAHVKWVPVDPDSFFDEEADSWILPPKLKD